MNRRNIEELAALVPLPEEMVPVVMMVGALFIMKKLFRMIQKAPMNRSMRPAAVFWNGADMPLEPSKLIPHMENKK